MVGSVSIHPSTSTRFANYYLFFHRSSQIDFICRMPSNVIYRATWFRFPKDASMLLLSMLMLSWWWWRGRDKEEKMDEHIDYITATASFEIHAGGDKTCPINSISINWYESLFAFSMSSEPALFILWVWTDERDNNPFSVVLCAPEKMTIAVKYVFAFERLPKLKKRKRCHRGQSRTKIQLKPVRERFGCDHRKERDRERSFVVMGHGGWEMEEEKCNLHLNNNDYCYVQGNCNTLRLPYGR